MRDDDDAPSVLQLQHDSEDMPCFISHHSGSPNKQAGINNGPISSNLLLPPPPTQPPGPNAKTK